MKLRRTIRRCSEIGTRFTLCVGLLSSASLSSSAQQINAVTNAASYIAGPVSWGGLHTIFGSDLANGTYYAQTSSPWPKQLGGTAVLFCEQNQLCHDLELLFVSPEQINFRFSLAFGSSGTLKIGAAEMNLEVWSDFPGIFIAGQDCPQCEVPLVRGVITDAAGRLVGTENPIRPDTSYVLWFSGLGIPNAIAGENLAPRNRLRLRLYRVSPSIDYRPSADAVIEYIGQSGEFPGLFQANFRIPGALLESWPEPPDNGRLEIWLALWGGPTVSNAVALPVRAE